MGDLLDEGWGCTLRLWRSKRGERPDSPFFGNSQTERGIQLEPLAAREYARVTGRLVKKAPWRGHPDFDYFGAHGDYLVLKDARGVGLLSVKVPSREEYFRLKRTGGDIPIGYLAQLQWELYVWEKAWGSFAILCSDPWQLQTWDYLRNDDMIANLVTLAHDFWRMKENGPAPEKKPPTDWRCAKCGYRVTCHAQDLQALLASNSDPNRTMPYRPELLPLVQRREERRQLLADAESLLEEAQNDLEAELGQQMGAELPGYRIYYHPFSGRESFNWKAFLKAHPEQREEIQKYVTKGAPSRPLRIYGISKRIGET